MLRKCIELSIEFHKSCRFTNIKTSYKNHLEFEFCAVTADWKLRWPNGRNAHFRGVAPCDRNLEVHPPDVTSQHSPVLGLDVHGRCLVPVLAFLVQRRWLRVLLPHKVKINFYCKPAAVDETFAYKSPKCVPTKINRERNDVFQQQLYHCVHQTIQRNKCS